MMNQEDLFKKIGSILQELQDQYEFLAQNPQQLNELELELFQANASFLSDHIQIIKKVNNKKPVRELPPPDTQLETIEPAKPVLDELFKPDQESPTFEFVLNDHPLSDKFDFEEKPVYEIFDRPLSFEEQEIISRKQQLLANQERGVFDIPAVPIAEVVEEPVEEESVPDTISINDKETDVNHSVSGPSIDLPKDEEFDAEPEKESFAFDFQHDEDEESVSAPEESVPFNEPEGIVQEELLIDEEDEIGPEPFLVIEEKPLPVPAAEPLAALAQPESPAHKQTLNEMLAASTGASKNTGFERSRLPVIDLKSAINLNQKLLYIKDLFNGYNLAYAEVIDILNKMPDFKTADNFLQTNYAVKNNWASKPGTVEQFYELLRLRFPD